MFILLLLVKVITQSTCPQIFYLSNIPSKIDQIQYSYEYNFIIGSMQEGIIFLQADSGTLRQYKQTSGQTVYQMQTSGSNLLIGEKNQVLIYSLDEENPITNSLSFQGNVNYIQQIDNYVSIATDQDLAILWNISSNQIESRLKSLQIQSILINYQITLIQGYDTLIIGTTSQGTMQLEYYTQNMQYELNSFQINNFQLYQIQSIPQQSLDSESYIYIVDSSTLYIYKIIKQSNQVTLTTNSLQLSFIPIQIQLIDNILQIFSNDCQVQSYDIQQQTLGQSQIWTNNCPNNIKQLIYNQIDLIIILLLTVQNQGDEIIRIYQVDQNLNGNTIRQFYYYNYEISYAYILQSQYIIEASTTSSNLYFYNQWYQLQNVLTVSNNNYKVIQIIQSSIILVLYENGLILTLSETSQNCQFSSYHCYSYNIEQQLQIQQVTNYNFQGVNSFTQSHIIYIFYALDDTVYFYSYQNKQFSSTPTNQQTLASNIIQIYLINNDIKFLLSNDKLYYCSYSIAKQQTTLSTKSFQLTGITQITENSQYQIITNGNTLQVYSNLVITKLLKEFTYIGIQFKQIQIQDVNLIILEQNSYTIQFYNLYFIIDGDLNPSLSFKTQYYSEQFLINQNNMIIQFNQYIMKIQLTDYFKDNSMDVCYFTQVYNNNQISFINTQLTLKSFFILYNTIEQLKQVAAQVQINTLNVYWNQIIFDQSINTNVAILITGKSITESSIIITDQIQNFLYILFQTITIGSSNCKLYFNSVQTIFIQDASFKYNNQECFYFDFNTIGSISIINYNIDNVIFTDDIITISNSVDVELSNLQITNSQFNHIITTTSEISLTLDTFTIENCKSTVTDYLIQYYKLQLSDSTFSDNEFSSTILTNYISNSIFAHYITINNLQILNNKFNQYNTATIISQYLVEQQKESQIDISEIVIQNNIYPQDQIIYSMNFISGLSISIVDAQFDNSSINIQQFTYINLTINTFSQASQLSINIVESPNIYLDRISFSSGTVQQFGLISIRNEQDYNCNQINICELSISRITMTDINFQSNSLADICYGIAIYLNDAFTVNFSSLNFFNLLLKSSEQNLISSATAIYFQGYASLLTISGSIFSTIRYSLSTSLFVLNALTVSLNQNNINTLQTVDNIYYGTQSEKGGVAQIVTASLYVLQCNISAINSYSGSIFIIQLFHSLNYMPVIILTNNLIYNIFSFGNGAIYVENNLQYTQITFQNNQFNNIYSLGDGGLLYCQNQQSLNNYSQLTQSTIIQDSSQLTKKINFFNNTFANLYSNGGSILHASFYVILIKNNNSFLYNNQTQTPQIFNTFTITQNSLFYVLFCNLTIQDFIIQNINYFTQQIAEGQIFYADYSMLMINNLTIQNIKTKKSSLFYIQNSNFDATNINFYNIIQDYPKIDQSLLQFYNSNCSIKQLNMNNLVCQYKNCLSSGLYAKNTTLNIFGGYCQQNLGNMGSCFYITNPTSNTIIDSIIFTQNQANISGGVMFLDLQNISSVVISYCQFVGNIALDSGGAIYINSLNPNFIVEETQDIPVVAIRTSTFISNIAHKYGGAIKTLVFYPKFEQNTFTNNTAYIEGYDNSSYPSSLFLVAPLESQATNQFVYDKEQQPVQGYYFVPYSNNGQYFLKNFKSGDTIQQEIQFILKSNNSNQTMYNDKAYLKIYPSEINNYSISISNPSRNSNEIRFQQGFFTLKDLTAIGIPGTEYPFQITSEEIKSLNKFQYYFTNNYNYTFYIVFRECLYGEIIQNFDNQTICYQCPFGFFSFELPTFKDPGQCQVCPLISTYHIYCNGGAQTNLQPLYWRENLTTLTIYKCDSQKSNCTGGISEYECGLGYMGRLCQACDYDQNYARDTRQVCVYCAQVEWPLTIILLGSIGILLYFTMSIFFLAQDVVILCLLPCLNQLLPPLKKIGSNLGQVKDLNSLMKIFLSYYQKIALVTKIVVDIPSQLQNTQDPSMFDFSLECPMINVNNYIPMVYVNYIIEVMKPISSIILFMFIWTILFRKQKIKRGIYYTATWLIVWLFYLPSFYEKTLQLLNCEQIGDGRYLKPDLNQTCYGTVHFFYTLFISIPCLVFFVIYIPIMLLYHIRNDMQKKDKRPLRKYKYYYISGEFTEKYYYWEFIRLLEKLLIQTSIEIFFYDNIYMAESCLIIVLIYGVASFVTQPYAYKRQNFINVISSFTAFATIYIALVIATLKNQFSDPNAPIIIFFEVLLAIINAIYALWMAWKLFIVLMPVLFVNIEQIQRKVSNIRCLRQLFLNERLRARLLFKKLGQKVIVINLVKKHALQRYLKKEQIEKQLIEIEEKIRYRKQTAAQDALNYILRNNDENQQQLKENNPIQYDYIELDEQNQQNH